ncbi:GAF domain-containing protein [Salinifilum aidingensis]
MRRDQLEPAVPTGTDPRRYARVLAAVHEATLSGSSPPVRPRGVIAQSWSRVRAGGLDPDRGFDPAPLPPDEVERRRRTCKLGELLPQLRGELVAVADAAAHIMVIADADGRVLWRDGSSAVRRRADALTFVEGADWSERTVGTNAIGTALATGRPVQVYSAEHYVRTHHPWTCSASPINDPASGAVLGVVDVSGPAATVHASTLALVDAVAKLGEMHLRTAHQEELERLRAVSAPLLARGTSPALVVDRHGWVAAVSGTTPVDRVLLPEFGEDAETWVPALGPCAAEPLPGGWLLRPGGDGPPACTTAQLDLRRTSGCTLTVSGPSGTWEHRLTPRHAEILYVLARTPEGRSAAALAGDLFGDADRTTTTRAEMSRLRRHLGGVLAQRPYRFDERVDVRVLHPEPPAEPLPESAAPGVLRLRTC